MKSAHPVSVRLRIDLGHAASIGPGKVSLLEQIERHRSLSQAARELGMSYRRAWQLLADLNSSFVSPVATASTGGSGGGGAVLTPFGRDLVRRYRSTERAATTGARRYFSRVGVSKDAPAPKKRTRLSRRGST